MYVGARVNVWWVLSRARWMLLVPALLFAFHIGEAWFLKCEVCPTDAAAYTLAVEAVDRGQSPYHAIPDPGPHAFGGDSRLYLYPPPFAALLSVVADSFTGVYRFVLAAGLLGTAALAVGVSGLVGRGVVLAGVIVLGLYVWPDPLRSIQMGNIQMAVNGAVVLALTLGPAAGLVLLLSAAAIKVTPVWAAGCVVVRCRLWRVATVTTFAWLGLTVARLGVVGTAHAVQVWASDIAPTLSQGQYVGLNLSPPFAFVRALVEAPPLGESIPAWARLYLTAMQLGIPILVILLTRRATWNVQAGWVLVAATLSAPILRPGYLPVLLLIPALWWRQRSEWQAGAVAEQTRARATVRHRIAHMDDIVTPAPE